MERKKWINMKGSVDVIKGRICKPKERERKENFVKYFKK